MIQTETMYELHNVELSIKLEPLEKELESLKKTQEKIRLHCNNLLPLNDLLRIEAPTTNEELLYNIQIDHYIQTTEHIKNKEEYREILLNTKVKFPIFNYVLKRFNELLVQKMIHEAYTFVNPILGTIRVVANKSARLKINWGESIKNKKALLTNGDIPYLKEDAELAKQEGREYKGKPWIVYMPPLSLFFKWEKDKANYIRTPQLNAFILSPTRGVDSSVQALMQYRKSLTDKEIEEKYKFKIA